jgi:hypothetical protein
MREATLERAAGCSALLGTDGLVVPIDAPIRDLEFALVETGLEFAELDRVVAGSLLEVETVGCLLEVEMVGILLEVETVGVLLLVELLNREFDLVAD